MLVPSAPDGHGEASMYLATDPTETSLPQPPVVGDGVVPSRFAARVSAMLQSAWDRQVLPEPSLDPDELFTAASRAEDLTDAGTDWQEPLRQLTRSLASEAALNPLGRTMAHGQLVKALRERLRAHALWKRRPEILDIPIVAPIVVLGSMRSGTTRVQRLLACDPRLAHTRLYESLSPVPPRRRPDLRAAKTAGGMAFLQRLNPALAAVHPTAQKLAEEEFGLFSFAFSGALFQAQWRVPGFARWWEAADPTPVYRDFRRLLQTIAWARPRGRGAPWVLKAPQFLEELDALLAVFPDARLLCLHRDAEAVVGSSCSLVWQQQRVQSDHADRPWIGREWLGKTERRVRMAAETRTRHAGVPQLDLHFDAVDRDWRGEMARVYHFLGMAFTSEAQHCMARYLDQSTAHRGHRYGLADFGLSAAEVRAVLGEEA